MKSSSQQNDESIFQFHYKHATIISTFLLNKYIGQNKIRKSEQTKGKERKKTAAPRSLGREGTGSE